MKLVLECLGCQETYEASEQIRYFIDSHSNEKENWLFAHTPYKRSHVHGYCGKTGQREVQLQQ